MLIALAGLDERRGRRRPANGQPPLAVMIDHARVVKPEQAMQTVIASGNLIIADVTVQRNASWSSPQELRGHEPHRARRRRRPALGVALISVRAPSESPSSRCSAGSMVIFLHAELPAVALLGDATKYFGRSADRRRSAIRSRTQALKAGVARRRAVETGPFSTIDLTVPKAFFRSTRVRRAARDAVPGGPQRWAA